MWVPIATAAAGVALGAAFMTGVQAQAGVGGAEAVCIEALGHAEDTFGIYSAGFTDAADVIEAYQRSDYRSMNAGTNRLGDRVEEIEGTLNAYWRSSDECRTAYQNGD